MWVSRSLTSALLAATVASIATPSFAQQADEATRNAARTLGYAGVEAYEAGDYAGASDKLEKAYQVLRVPTLGLWSARALAKRDKLVEAADRYREVAALDLKGGGDVKVQKQAQTEARSELEALSPRIPKLRVRIEGAGSESVSVTIDGQAVDSAEGTHAVNPGAHRIAGTAGAQNVELELTLREGEEREALLEFTPSSAGGAPASPGAGTSAAIGTTGEAPRSSSTVKTLGWVALGVGGAGLIAGGVTGFLAMNKESAIKENANCNDDLQCLPSEKSSVEGYNTFRTVSSITLIAGGALAATGIVLLVTAPGSSESQTSLVVGPSAVALRGKF